MSLVTLFEVGGKKALLCGDTTFSTEKFLLDIHGGDGGLLQDIDLLQVPHHGSSYASSTDFVNKINPKAAVVSVGFLEHSYRLPRYENVVERWLEKVEGHYTPPTNPDPDAMDVEPPTHSIDYWTNDDGEGKDGQEYLNEWTEDGTAFTNVSWNESETFFYLKQGGYKVIAFYRLQNGYSYLYRESIPYDLTMTSQKTQVFKLTSTGVSKEL